MGHIAWGNFIMGGLFILIGVGLAASQRFGAAAVATTAQGDLWNRLLGPKWTPIAFKYVFSLMAIALGAWVIYAGIYGYD